MAVSAELLLDSWIVVAWLKAQLPAAHTMRDLWARAEGGECRLSMNVVNAGEVYYLTGRRKGLEAAEKVITNLRERGVEILPAADSLVWDACRLKTRYPISLADAMAASTAIKTGWPLVTGDPELRRLESDGLLHLEWAG